MPFKQDTINSKVLLKIASKKIPKTYDDAAIDKWAAKVEKLVYTLFFRF